jgi:hypothetical protein
MNITPADQATLKVLLAALTELSHQSFFKASLSTIVEKLKEMTTEPEKLRAVEITSLEYVNKHIRQPILDLYDRDDSYKERRKNALFHVLIALCRYWPVNDVCYLTLEPIKDIEEKNQVYCVSGHVADMTAYAGQTVFLHPLFSAKKLDGREVAYNFRHLSHESMRNEFIRAVTTNRMSPSNFIKLMILGGLLITLALTFSIAMIGPVSSSALDVALCTMIGVFSGSMGGAMTGIISYFIHECIRHSVGRYRGNREYQQWQKGLEQVEQLFTKITDARATCVPESRITVASSIDLHDEKDEKNNTIAPVALAVDEDETVRFVFSPPITEVRIHIQKELRNSWLNTIFTNPNRVVEAADEKQQPVMQDSPRAGIR